MATTDLHDMELDEVSFVDAGANPHAKVALFKRAYKTEYGRQFPMSDYAYVPDPTKPSTWKLRMTANPGGGANARIIGAAMAALGPTGFRGNKVQIPSSALPKVKAKIRAEWKKLHPDAKEIPAVLKHLEVSNEQWEQLLKSFEDDPHFDDETGGNDMSPEELEKLKKQAADFEKANETLAAEKKDLETKLAKALEDIEALKKAADNDDDDDINKRKDIPEDVRKAMDAQDAEIKKQADVIAKMVEDSERKEFISKARDSYANVPVSAEDLGEALRLVSKNAPEALESIEKALVAGNVALKRQFDELGDGGSDDEDGSAISKLNKMAEDMSKEKGITFEQAFVKVKDANQDLWKESRKERTH